MTKLAEQFRFLADVSFAFSKHVEKFDPASCSPSCPAAHRLYELLHTSADFDRAIEEPPADRDRALVLSDLLQRMDWRIGSLVDCENIVPDEECVAAAQRLRSAISDTLDALKAEVVTRRYWVDGRWCWCMVVDGKAYGWKKVEGGTVVNFVTWQYLGKCEELVGGERAVGVPDYGPCEEAQPKPDVKTLARAAANAIAIASGALQEGGDGSDD